MSVTVLRSVFSAIASTNVRRAFAWSTVLARVTKDPIGCESARLVLISSSSLEPFVELTPVPSSRLGGGDGRTFLPPDIGKTFNSSSTTRHDGQLPKERIKRSLKRAVTSL